MDFKHVQRIVLKIGTNVVMDPKNLEPNLPRLESILGDLLGSVATKSDVLIVTSGAVGLGKSFIKSSESLAVKQAWAAMGQPYLMNDYQSILKKFGKQSAQILLTSDDLADRKRYLNLRETMETLLKWGVIPIINENDTVSTMELREENKNFGDNDKLSALIASKLGADLLILLTDMDGIYTDNPKKNKQAGRLNIIKDLHGFDQAIGKGKTDEGRGGIQTKLEAVRIASISGVYSVVDSGLRPGVIKDIFSSSDTGNNPHGTHLHPINKLSNKRRWLGFSSGVHGRVMINSGAHEALLSQASLLPIGVVSVEGNFQPGQVISIQDESEREVGRGIINYSVDEAKQIIGFPSQEISERLGKASSVELVHRDNLVIFEEV